MPESEENLRLMRLLDEQYTRTPISGKRKKTAWLHTQGYAVDRKRVGRLLRLMGLEAIYPKPRTSVPASGEQHYPYAAREECTSRDAIRSGAVTSPTSAYSGGLSISWQ